MACFRIKFEFREVMLSVVGEYEPEEKRTYWHPGCADSISIESVAAGTIDLTGLFELEYITSVEYRDGKRMEFKSSVMERLMEAILESNVLRGE